MKISGLEEIVEGGLCAGCGIGESIAGRDVVEMDTTMDGRIRPYNKKSLDQKTFNQIMQVCPGVTITGPAGKHTCPIHPIWGPVASLHKGWASDEKIRFHAAAGGALTALGMYLIRTGKWIQCSISRLQMQTRH